jgi:hypothetical protein
MILNEEKLAILPDIFVYQWVALELSGNMEPGSVPQTDMTNPPCQQTPSANPRH